MRLSYSIRLGILTGSVHVLLCFLIPVYQSYVSKFFLGDVLSIPIIFLFGLSWPILLFLAFAPRHQIESPDVQEFIRKYGQVFRLPTDALALRVVCLLLLWPVSILNVMTFYEGVQP
jgi:hypothetical protein